MRVEWGGVLVQCCPSSAAMGSSAAESANLCCRRRRPSLPPPRHWSPCPSTAAGGRRPEAGWCGPPASTTAGSAARPCPGRTIADRPLSPGWSTAHSIKKKPIGSYPTPKGFSRVWGVTVGSHSSRPGPTKIVQNFINDRLIDGWSPFFQIPSPETPSTTPTSVQRGGAKPQTSQPLQRTQSNAWGWCTPGNGMVEAHPGQLQPQLGVLPPELASGLGTPPRWCHHSGQTHFIHPWPRAAGRGRLSHSPPRLHLTYSPN